MGSGRACVRAAEVRALRQDMVARARCRIFEVDLISSNQIGVSVEPRGGSLRSGREACGLHASNAHALHRLSLQTSRDNRATGAIRSRPGVGTAHKHACESP